MSLFKSLLVLFKKPHYKTAIIYLIISFVWIIYSDRIAYDLFNTMESYKYIQSLKGIFFIISTSIIIFFLIRKDYRTIKQKNSELNSQKIQMQMAFDAAEMGTYKYDFDEGHIYLDDRSKKIFGFDKEVISILELTNLIHPNDIENVNKTLIEILSSDPETKFLEDYRIILRDGTIKWIEASMIIIPKEENGLQRLNWGIGTFLDITEKKNSNEQLNILLHAVENVNIGVTRFDDNGKIIFANRHTCNYLGYTKDEILSLYAFDIDKNLNMQNVIKNKNSWIKNQFNPIETLHTKKDGTTLPVEVALSYFSYNEKLYVFAFVKDITEQKTAALKLMREKNILKIFIDNAPAAIAMFDNEMRYISASKRYCVDFNLKQSNIIGKCHYDIFPEINENWKQIHRRCLAGSIERSNEDAFQRLDGKIDWLRWEVRPWYEADNSIGGIIIFSELITKQKQTENDLKLSEQRLNVALEGAELGTWLWNVKTDETVFNNRWAEMLGYLKSEISENFYNWESRIHPDDLPFVKILLDNHLLGKTKFYESEHRLKHKNGKWIWILDKGKIIERDQKGQPLILAGTHLDITAKKEAEIELVNARNQLKALFANIDRITEEERKTLARDLHDELGQVLTSLKMNISFLKSKIEQKSYDDVKILLELEEMTNIIDLSKTNVKNLIRSLRPECLDNLGLIPALNYLIDEFRKATKITMDFKHNFEELKIDAQKENTIYRVIQESLTNISKHSKASKSQIIILMNDNKINVTISDNGIGFQGNELKKINSFGIIGIKERLSQIGSELKIDSNETGTILNFEIFI
ncbi:MAG: PAS domain S-box protein [Ignavibacteriae bacterium]|nr:PAS domain S-box protein [Ignavibacteriota bacterium]